MLKKTMLKTAMLKKTSVFLGALSLAACAWVSPSQESQYVSLIKTDAVSSCKKLGDTRVKTVAKVLLSRSSEKISNELITLAKKEAVVMGGDSIAASGSIIDGEQVFGVYDCR